MGNGLTYQSICTPSHPFRQQFPSSHTSVGHIIHPRFGQIQLYRQNRNKKVNIFIKEINYPSKIEMVNVAKKLSRRLKETHPNLLQIYDFIGSEIDEVCGSQNTLKIFVQYVEGSLRREIKHRLKYKNFGFGEPQLQKILCQLVLALSYLHQRKQFHGQIKMSDILIGNNNQIKLIDKAISMTSFQIGQQGQNVSIIKGKGILFAPSIMKCLENKKTQINSYDPFKGDVFSIGMVMLECISLEEAELCYDYQTCVIRRQRVEYLILKAKNQYSQRILTIVESMLGEYDEQRPTARQILIWLQEYQRSKVSSKTSIGETLALGEDNGVNITFS